MVASDWLIWLYGWVAYSPKGPEPPKTQDQDQKTGSVPGPITESEPPEPGIESELGSMNDPKQLELETVPEPGPIARPGPQEPEIEPESGPVTGSELGV